GGAGEIMGGWGREGATGGRCGANLAGATLGSADLEDAVFDDANLCGADFCASSASSTRRPLPSPAAHNLTRPPNGWFFDKATRFPPGFDPGKSLPLDQLSLYFDDVR
ncbi:MAG: pentapeptide repeat-containing protein, partial [Myxococcota bacterium]